MTTTRIEKTYLGKGASRRTAWAVREYTVIGGVDVRETLGTWATEEDAIKAASR